MSNGVDRDEALEILKLSLDDIERMRAQLISRQRQKLRLARSIR